MSQSVHLVNNHHGVVDLSMISDVVGKPVVLRPKGHAGASRECFADVLEHPHVKQVLKAKWVRVEDAAPTAPAAEKHQVIIPDPPKSLVTPPPRVSAKDPVSGKTDIKAATEAEQISVSDDVTTKVSTTKLAELAAESVKVEEPPPATDPATTPPPEGKKKPRR